MPHCLNVVTDKSAASDALLKALSVPYPSPDSAVPHPISLPHTSRIYKTLLQGGHFSHAAQAVEQAPLFSAPAFAARFVQLVGREATVAMACGDGAFVVSALCLTVGENEEKTSLKNWFGEQTRKEIQDSSSKGAGVLFQQLKALG